MSNVGYYNYYQQQSQTYMVPPVMTGCEHKTATGCITANQSSKCCFCVNPVQVTSVPPGRLAALRPNYCAPCHGFWNRKIELGKSKAPSSNANGDSSASSSRDSPDQSRSSVAATEANLAARLNAPFNSVPYIPQAGGLARATSVSTTANSASARFKHLMMSPVPMINTGPQTGKKRQRTADHKHSSSESSTNSYKRNGNGEGSSTANATRMENVGDQTRPAAYACPAVRAMDRRVVSMMESDSERRWTLANPYGVPGAIYGQMGSSNDNSNRLRPAGTSTNSNGGFQTYRPPSPTYPTGQCPDLSIIPGPSSSRSNGNYQNYKPPNGPSYQPYRPGAASSSTSPNATSSASQSNTAAPQRRESRSSNNQSNSHSGSAPSPTSTPISIVTPGGMSIISSPQTRAQSTTYPSNSNGSMIQQIDLQGPQNRAASNLRLGDNTISTRSDSAPRAGGEAPVLAERYRTRSWDGTPAGGRENLREPDDPFATLVSGAYFPTNWVRADVAAAPAARAAVASNEQSPTLTSNPPMSSSPVQFLNDSSTNTVSSGQGGPVTENSSTYEAPQARVYPGPDWLEGWKLPFERPAPQEAAGPGPSTASTISWVSGDTRRNTVSGNSQNRDAPPDSPAASRRKMVVSGRITRPSMSGHYQAVHDPQASVYVGRFPPPRPMETAIPPSYHCPAFPTSNETGGWPSTNVFQRRQTSENWLVDPSTLPDLEVQRGAPANRPERRERPAREQAAPAPEEARAARVLDESARAHEDREQTQAIREIDVGWVSALPLPRTLENQNPDSGEQIERRDLRAVRHRSPRNQSPQDRSPQNRSPRQRGRRASHSPTSPFTSSQPAQLIDLTETVPAPRPQTHTQYLQSQLRTSTSSASLAPVIPPIPSTRSSPSEEWETWDNATWEAAASEMSPGQRDVGKLAEDASVLLELFYKTKPHSNAELGDEYKSMIENAYKSIMEIKKEMKMISEDENSTFTPASPTGKRDDSQNPEDCIVCFSSNADTVLLPCKHMVLCGECCDKMNFKESGHITLNRPHCPVCRATVDSRMKIYRG